jgi:hypothetical protein
VKLTVALNLRERLTPMPRVRLTVDLNPKVKLTLMSMPSQKLIPELRSTLELNPKPTLGLTLRLSLVPLLSLVPRLKVSGTGSLDAAHVPKPRQN